MKLARMLVAIGFVAHLALPAAADGDVEKGERVFRKCKACHSLEEGQMMMGPSLHGVMGRTSGTVEGYKYSKAMVDAAIVWNEETLAAYLQSPRTYVKGTKMAFVGLRKPEEITDLLAYLEANGG
ncbi:c-type cytochrome [Kordiimonas pumila]|uniref:C-type cytochrome n=1 Tax=Kordiimonas pumila TaxID=2161677 RepID=A0ABV7D6Z7_9PROT|nr:cytochrome c family protein [Kordiimonas pumila]